MLLSWYRTGRGQRPMAAPDQVTYCRGDTMIRLKMGADRRFWLQVNDGTPTPLTQREMGDLLFDWVFYLRSLGVEIGAYDPLKGH